MEKEQITLNQIKKDLMQYVYREIIGIIIGFFLLWLVLAIGNFVICTFFSLSNLTFKLLTLILCLCAILSFVYICIIFTKVKKLKFTVRNDILIEKRNFKPGGTTWHSYKPYQLYFNQGYFDIPAQLHYKWSNKYSMNEKEIYNTALVGDTFTLVELNRKVLVVYNNKFFEYII